MRCIESSDQLDVGRAVIVHHEVGKRLDRRNVIEILSVLIVRHQVQDLSHPDQQLGDHMGPLAGTNNQPRVVTRNTSRSCACIVGMAGFEPATPCSQSRCATKLRHIP